MSVFREIKERFAAEPKTWTTALGLTFGKKAHGSQKGKWLHGVVCPFCGDTDGSASIVAEEATNTGFLHCHACGAEKELFDWTLTTLKILPGHKPAYSAAKVIAGMMGVTIEPTTINLNRRPLFMTDAVAAAAKDRLIKDFAHSGMIHAWCQKRGWDVEKFADLGFGACGNNELLIVCYDEQSGNIRKRYRRYDINTKSALWSSGVNKTKGLIEPQRAAVPGMWPRNNVPDGDGHTIYLTEGEWDTVAAILSSSVTTDPQSHAYAWQGGANSTPSGSQLPSSWSGKKVIICWDNDQFQGPDQSKLRGPYIANLRKQLDPDTSRLKRLADRLMQHGCHVRVAAIPLDPIDHPKGDLRDWLDKGNKDLNQLPTWEPHEVWDQPQEVTEIEGLQHIATLPQGTPVHFRAQMQEFDRERQVLPTKTVVECRYGDPEFASLCSKCGIPCDFPDFQIEWSKARRHLFQAYSSSSPDDTMLKILGKPAGCNSCRLNHTEERDGFFWTAMDEEDSTKTTLVVGGSPSISGNMDVTGVVYTTRSGGRRGVLATNVKEVDATEFQLDEVTARELELGTPSSKAPIEEIEKFLTNRYLDIGSNITKIYNRDVFHLITELVFHSPLWIAPFGERVRGFLDVCLFGDTRLGKTKVVERYINAVGLGSLRTPMSTISRAGLLVSNRDGKMRPGIWPKHHGRMLSLDEFHNMSQNPMLRQIIIELQSARDAGTITSGKDAGDFTLPGAVRFLAIANWWKNRDVYTRPIDHLARLYLDQPQVISRLDFAFAAIKNELPPPTPTEAFQDWTPETLRANIRRCWAMTEDSVVFEPDAIKLAQRACDEWDERYDAVAVPLYTGMDKVISLLRVAASMANICFSHPNDVSRCLVQPVHVLWARKWMESTWRNLGYDTHSDRRMDAQRVREEFLACHRLYELMPTSLDAMASLPMMMNGQTQESLAGLFEWDDFTQSRNFLSMLRRHQIFELGDDNMFYPTTGGRKLMQRLLDCARDDKPRYEWHRSQTATWFSNRNDPRVQTPKALSDDLQWREFLEIGSLGS